ncbi:hypothetical protein AB1Y20_014602 [Prymnesium parvum]|uniref:Kinetochore protein Spc24 n=1 Tax=Prymnesium parvum TaxID=97485 RepID=A0AB34IB29_PRYPA
MEEPNYHAEREAILQDVLKVFCEKGDVHAVREAGRKIVDLQAAGEARHKQMLESIKELSRQVDHAKQEHAEQKVSLLNPAQKQRLLEEHGRVHDNIKKLRQETEGLREKVHTVEGKARELAMREQQIKQEESVEVPRARHTISLYANISSIRWDYNSENVKGWITGASGSGLKAFELDPSKHSQYFITNCLWDLMDNC